MILESKMLNEASRLQEIIDNYIDDYFGDDVDDDLRGSVEHIGAYIVHEILDTLIYGDDVYERKPLTNIETEEEPDELDFTHELVRVDRKHYTAHELLAQAEEILERGADDSDTKE